MSGGASLYPFRPVAGDWVDQAACAQEDVDLFFPRKGESLTPAKKVCASCPVRQECLDYAIANHENLGVWGGLSSNERRVISGPFGQVKPYRHGTEAGYNQHRRRGDKPCFDCQQAKTSREAERRRMRAS